MKRVINSRMLFICLLFLLHIVSTEHVQLELTNDQQLSQGQHFYEDLQLKTSSPHYGLCWTEAIQDLHTGCKHLTEHTQQRLAFKFATCFLASSGKSQPDCHETIKECITRADSTMFSAYQTFFVHTQSICFYLKSEVWQENTQNVITRLSTTSHEVTKRLEKSSSLQKEILKLQSESNEHQKSLLQLGKKLEDSIDNSHQKALETFELYKKTTNEQKDTFNRIFNRIIEVQSSIFGIFTGFNSFIFYIFAFLISYLLTSQNRTSSGRFWMMIVLSVALILEHRWKPQPYEHNREQPYTGLSPETWTLYLRSLVCFVNSLILMVQYWSYRDYLLLNWQAQHNVERKVSLLFNEIQGLSYKLDNVARGNLSIEGPQASSAVHDFSDDDSSDDSFHGTSSDDGETEDQGIATDSHGDSPHSDSEVIEELNILKDLTPFKIKLDESINLNSSGKSRYNLRTRRSGSLSSPNPALQKESPRSFAGLVKKLAQKKKTPQRSQKSQFSSDDE